jgi:hypothetical protein
MAENLANAKEAMPTLPQWPRVVDALGNGIASVPGWLPRRPRSIGGTAGGHDPQRAGCARVAVR